MKPPRPTDSARSCADEAPRLAIEPSPAIPLSAEESHAFARRLLAPREPNDRLRRAVARFQAAERAESDTPES